MKKKLVTLTIVMAIVLSMFCSVNAAEHTWTTVFEDDFNGDLSKWTEVTEGLDVTSGTLDFNGFGSASLNTNYNGFSDTVSIEFDFVKVSSGLNFRIRDEEGNWRLVCVKGRYDMSTCEVWDSKDNYIGFGESLLPNETVTVKYVINSGGITMYKKAVGESDDAYEVCGNVYDDTAIDMFKDGVGIKIEAIYYQSALTQPEDKTFKIGDETVTMTVYPVAIDNLKIKNVKYGTQNFAPAFSDDFSSGNLDKWTGENSSLFPAADGGVGINVYNATLIPKDFQASKNIMLQFDVKGWMEGIYVQFTDPEDASNSFRSTLHPKNVNGWAQLWDLGDVWINYANNSGIDGGTADVPKVNSIRYVLSEGVLSVYIKTENDADFVYKGSHSYKANDGVISNTAYYIPAFYVIGSQDSSQASSVIMDNVIIKTIPENSVSVGAKTVEYNFDTEESLNEWDVPAFYYDGTDFKSDKPAYTWNEDGSVFMYMFGGTAYPKNPVSADEFTAYFTYNEPGSGNSTIYLQFTNTANDADYVRIRIADWCVSVTDENSAEVNISGGAAIFKPGSKTVKFDLASDKLAVSGGDTTGDAVLNGDDFKKYFTAGAEYKVGIYTVIAANATPVNIDSLIIKTAATAEINTKLVTETAKNIYSATAMPAAGESCRVELTVDGSLSGKLIAAAYDNNMLIDVKIFENINDVNTADFEIPETAVKPAVKVMAWESLAGNITPMSEAMVYTAE